MNSQIASQFAAINGIVSDGSITSTSNFQSFNQINWHQGSPTTYYYPAARVDYNLSDKVRMYLSWLMTKQEQPDNTAGDFPGAAFADQIAGNATKNYTSSYGFDYIFSPQLLNQFKAGYLYDATFYAYNAAPLYATAPSVNWSYPGASGQMSGQSYNLPTSTYYPIFNLSDSMTWQRGKHTIQYGASWYREQDHYWNPPAGFSTYSLGLAGGDPAINAFTTGVPSATSSPTLPYASQAGLAEADQLYAVLTGRIASVTGESPYSIKNQSYNTPGQTGEYPLDEISSAYGFFGEDSWKITRSLTLNFGLRWDIYSPEKDLTGFYHSADPASIYGPSGVGNLFNPGSLKGTSDPTLAASPEPYNPWKITPQPSFGFAWNPKTGSGPAKFLGGEDGTVFRGGFALRRFTEPYQYFWDAATRALLLSTTSTSFSTPTTPANPAPSHPAASRSETPFQGSVFHPPRIRQPLLSLSSPLKAPPLSTASIKISSSLTQNRGTSACNSRSATRLRLKFAITATAPCISGSPSIPTKSMSLRTASSPNSKTHRPTWWPAAALRSPAATASPRPPSTRHSAAQTPPTTPTSSTSPTSTPVRLEKWLASSPTLPEPSPTSATWSAQASAPAPPTPATPAAARAIPSTSSSPTHTPPEPTPATARPTQPASSLPPAIPPTTACRSICARPTGTACSTTPTTHGATASA